MDIGSIRNALSNYENAKVQAQPVPSSDTTSTKSTDTSATDSDNGVIYESSYLSTLSPENAAIVTKMKDDLEQRKSQLESIVQQMMKNQGLTLAKADDVWSFLASGNYTVDEAAKKQAQEDISQNGYWGVDKTSDRILDFAKALSGNDVSKANDLLDAFKKGYDQATKSWGKDLPDISKQTYQAVLDKFDKWKNGDDTTTSSDTPDTSQTSSNSLT